MLSHPPSAGAILRLAAKHAMGMLRQSQSLPDAVAAAMVVKGNSDA